MKNIFLITSVFMLFLTGCQQTTKMENIKIGMSLADAQELAPLEKFAENDTGVVYRCWVDGGTKSMLQNRSVLSGNEPYLLLFSKSDEKLVELKFDEGASNRRIRSRSSYQYNPNESRDELHRMQQQQHMWDTQRKN